MNETDEPQRVVERYARRVDDGRYSPLRAEVWQSLQERQRAILRLFGEHLGWQDFAGRTLCEIGCGGGSGLLDFLRMGFAPENLTGLELIAARAARARSVLPAASSVFEGDAIKAPVAEGSQDVVFQSVVFSSLLDEAYQAALAARMWAWVRPGGGVLWYDFIYDNPANADVKKVSVKRIRELFPAAQVRVQRLTLAPPIARRVCRLHPFAYTVFNMPFLRTHVLAWIEKPGPT
ncbi:MAG: class I SAM-dependent methyltransferase [Caldimonas sp.]